MGFLTPKSKLKTYFIKKTKQKNNILTFAHISTAGGSQALQSVGRKPTRGGFVGCFQTHTTQDKRRADKRDIFLLFNK